MRSTRCMRTTTAALTSLITGTLVTTAMTSLWSRTTFITISRRKFSIYVQFFRLCLWIVTPAFGAHCCHMGTAMKHPVPDRVKPAFVIFDIRALWRSALSEFPDVKNNKLCLNPVWHRMLYSCTHMATVGVKGLICCGEFWLRWIQCWNVFIVTLISSVVDGCFVSSFDACANSVTSSWTVCCRCLYSAFRKKKHPLTFSAISPWVMCRFKQKLQRIYPRNGRFWPCRN